MPLPKLSNDIINQVADFLSNEDINQASLASKNLNKLFSNDALWQKKIASDFNISNEIENSVTKGESLKINYKKLYIKLNQLKQKEWLRQSIYCSLDNPIRCKLLLACCLDLPKIVVKLCPLGEEQFWLEVSATTKAFKTFTAIVDELLPLNISVIDKRKKAFGLYIKEVDDDIKFANLLIKRFSCIPKYITNIAVHACHSNTVKNMLDQDEFNFIFTKEHLDSACNSGNIEFAEYIIKRLDLQQEGKEEDYLTEDRKKNYLAKVTAIAINQYKKTDNNPLPKSIVDKVLSYSIEQKFLLAILIGDLDLVKKIIQNDKLESIYINACINEANFGYATPDLIKYMLDKYYLTDTVRLLTDAIFCGNLPLVQFLISKINKLNGNNLKLTKLTPNIYSSEVKIKNVIKFLIEEQDLILDLDFLKDIISLGYMNLTLELINHYDLTDDKIKLSLFLPALQSNNLILIQLLLNKNIIIYDKELFINYMQSKNQELRVVHWLRCYHFSKDLKIHANSHKKEEIDIFDLCNTEIYGDCITFYSFLAQILNKPDNFDNKIFKLFMNSYATKQTPLATSLLNLARLAKEGTYPGENTLELYRKAYTLFQAKENIEMMKITKEEIKQIDDKKNCSMQ